MFLHVSVTLFTVGGGVAAPLHAGIPAPLGTKRRHPPPVSVSLNEHGSSRIILFVIIQIQGITRRSSLQNVNLCLSIYQKKKSQLAVIPDY